MAVRQANVLFLLAAGLPTFSSSLELGQLKPQIASGASPFATEDVCSSGRRQSPVNIITDDAVTVRTNRFKVSESWKKRPIYTNYTNNGHSVFVQTKNKKSRLISGGILGDRIYSFQQIHWHWGSNNNGSEHTVNGKRYSMEQHFVFYNTESENPVEDKHGIVVIALFYTRSKISNSQLEPVLNSGALGEPGETIKKEGGLSLYSFMPHIGGKGKFWSYKGSLTTPPCSENVLWIIFPTPRPVSSIQLKRFTTLKNFQGDFVKRNVRPTQPLNGRKVELLKFG